MRLNSIKNVAKHTVVATLGFAVAIGYAYLTAR